VRPFAGLYAELLQQNRTTAVYGELSLSPFESQSELLVGFDLARNPIISSYEYRAWLGTARLGVRFFFQLPREQQLLLTSGFELNTIMNYVVRQTGGPVVQGPYQISFAAPTLLPNLGFGWHAKRLTLSLDGQFYYAGIGDAGNPNASVRATVADFFSDLFFSRCYALRLGAAYQLGKNPDQTAR
jgi:hypothetical protein